MTAVITALVGLVGVLVGVLLSFFLQRRLWQTQEAMKAYSELFAIGDETLRSWNTLASGEGDEVHVQGLLRDKHDPAFRRVLQQCWMLEKDASIREQIGRLQRTYSDYTQQLDRQFPSLNPSPEGLFPLLESLQREVAGKYFHGGAPSGEAGNEDQKET